MTGVRERRRTMGALPQYWVVLALAGGGMVHHEVGVSRDEAQNLIQRRDREMETTRDELHRQIDSLRDRVAALEQNARDRTHGR